MTEDLWAEKPQPMLHGVDLETYDAEELNFWLEKLKSSFEESIADCHRSLELVAKKLGEYREKAERWDQYAIYDNDKEAEIPVKDLISAYEKLEAIRMAVKGYEGMAALPDPLDLDLAKRIKEILEDEA